MSETSVLRQRINSVMDILTSAAVTEICKLVEDCCGALSVEVSQSKEQIKMLEKQLGLTESRYKSVSCKEGQTLVTSGSSRTNSPSGNSPADDADDTHDDKDFQQFIVSEVEFHPEQQHCKQEWSPGLGQDDWNPIQIKEEQEEFRIIQEEEDSVFTPAWVKSDYDQYSTQSSQTQSEEYKNRTKPKQVNSSKPTSGSRHQHKSRRTQAEKGKSFISSKGRKSMDLKSPVQRKCQTENKSFCCSDCGERFTQMGKLNSHRIMIHSGGNQFRCDECGKCFAQWGYLDSHMRIHTRVNCGKVFTQSDRFKPSLTTLKDHTGEKCYCCGECGKYFSNAGSLNYHRRSHTEEKSHRCHDCGKCFFKFRDLNIHRRIHTGEKRFRCQFCGKCYNQHTSLSYHMKNHTGDIL